MSFLSAIPIIGDVIDAFSKGDTARQEIKKIKSEGAIKQAAAIEDNKLKVILSDAESAGNLDAISARNVGWKDEYLMIIITIPTILAFIPFMVSYVEDGFKVLEQMPDYYQYMLAGVYIYVFGFKRILLKVINKFVEVKFGKG